MNTRGGRSVVAKRIWYCLPRELRDVKRKAAAEAGEQIKAKSRVESNQAVEAMRKRGPTVHAATPDLEVAWCKAAERFTGNPWSRSPCRDVRRTESFAPAVSESCGLQEVTRAMSDQAKFASNLWDPGINRTTSQAGWLLGFENGLVCFALAALVVLPLAEIVLRATLQTGISGSTALVQHMTLVIGMLGGAVAARENRLLGLSTGSAFLRGRLKMGAALFSGAVAAAISFFLLVASYQFVLTEREAGSFLAYNVPVWLIQCVMPLGFGLVAVRLLYYAGETWKVRALAAALTGFLILLALRLPVPPAEAVTPALIGLLVATVLGSPVFATLGGAALILFWGADLPIASIPLDHYRLVINPSLPTIPLFTLAGYFLAEGGASQRLVRVFQALFGQFRGGPAIVTALVCAFFTSFTGASGVTILALGGLLMPILLTAGYPPKSALGLLTGAGSLGLLFPPCLPLILYAIVAKISIEDMFLGGFVPGILMVALTAWWGTTQGPKRTINRQLFVLGEAKTAIWNAKWECSCRRLRSQGCLVGLRHPWKPRPLLRSTPGLLRRSYIVTSRCFVMPPES